MSRVRVVIFAKAPQPGLAKTRLIPSLGAQGAADLAQRMLTHTLAQVLAAAVGPLELCVTPSAMDAAWRGISVPEGIFWSDQGEGDLGARMARAVQRVTSGGDAVLLIGTDCPALAAAHLRRAARALRHFDATLIPTVDGGYVLLGLNRFDQSLFEHIEWSTHRVAAATLKRLAQLGWTRQNNAMLRDIDEPDDLRWLPDAWLKSVAHNL
ncbi:MAG: TIGR04282 family arsenosugar biosynthesis glycosyltransferase [Betaproteobacteria bacterium]